ncbi:protease complex subunit PrcB family protein [Micromonospora sp. C31]|uniref:protease complex subunit PrcB family protein n=1 Tax=Micromonospora sp. C31 TaxID=2824876 RepID=UPI001B37E360|nr:protease complex subunit PrcB family protein [Micromonospora sp. C31]MBQ1074461.1 protease complex subunit PrcB family protein [Micromonospora sp. C31]
MSRSSGRAANFRTLYHGQATVGAVTGYGLFLIRRSGSWARHWSSINAGRRPVPPPPLVDLAHETVIMLSVGTRPVLGYDVTIEDVTVRETTLVVTGVERRPVGGVALDTACSPVHVVAARFGPQTFADMLLNLRIKPAETAGSS